MVDLVKIRKKAKKAAPAEETPQPEASEVAGSQSPVAELPEPEPDNEQLATGNEQPATDNRQPATDNRQPATDNRQPATDNRQPEAEHESSSKLDRFKEEAGHRREGLIVGSEETTEANVVELLTFVIAGEQYAVHIENIVEIVTPRPVTRIPNADPSIVGIMSLRGTIVTLLDARRKLRHPPAGPAGEDTRIVVIEHRGETVGFEVDKVHRVVKTDSAAIEPHPVVHMSELDEAIRGVFRHANALTILLDLDKLLGSRGQNATQEVAAARR